MKKSLNPEQATHKQIRDWKALSAMGTRIEGELQAIKAMARTYPDIESALEQALAVIKAYGCRPADNYDRHLQPYATRPRRDY